MNVSIGIMAYNEEENIKDCIDSILRQTLKIFNLVVIDDGSTDKTPAIIKNFKDSRITYIKNKTRDG
jgi:glycosyltransferase involved in cell wall biosynthesis